MLVRRLPFVGANQKPYTRKVRGVEAGMPNLMPFVGLLSAVLCLFVIVSIVVGQLWDSVMVTGNIEIESQRYTIYVEDVTHRYRVQLEGTHCFEALPAWVYPDPDAAPSRPPTFDPGRFFLEMTHDVIDVLDRCYV